MERCSEERLALLCAKCASQFPARWCSVCLYAEAFQLTICGVVPFNQSRDRGDTVPDHGVDHLHWLASHYGAGPWSASGAADKATGTSAAGIARCDSAGIQGADGTGRKA